jgi:hypothetical protein
VLVKVVFRAVFHHSIFRKKVVLTGFPVCPDSIIFGFLHEKAMQKYLERGGCEECRFLFFCQRILYTIHQAVLQARNAAATAG